MTAWAKMAPEPVVQPAHSGSTVGKAPKPLCEGREVLMPNANTRIISGTNTTTPTIRLSMNLAAKRIQNPPYSCAPATLAPSLSRCM